MKPRPLPLEGGEHAGPLFAPMLMVRKAAPRRSGGAEVWRKWKRAMPVWADRNAIRSMWELSRIWTCATGVQHSVDHIVPLRHPLVSGLHVPANLRVITLAENARKSNCWWPDMPEEQASLFG